MHFRVMAPAALRIDSTAPPMRAGGGVIMPVPVFAGLLEPVLVEHPSVFPTSSCIARPDATTVWRFVVRDLCPDLIPPEPSASEGFAASQFEAVVPVVVDRIRTALALAATDQEAERRLRAQLNGEAGLAALPLVLVALRAWPLLDKAAALGKAMNAITDAGGMGRALATLPLGDPPLAALLFHAMLSQISNPGPLVLAAIKAAGGAGEVRLSQAGFAPLVEAVFAQAQQQALSLQPQTGFTDMDLACRRVERFHRLMRALTGNVEFARASRWSAMLSGIVKLASERVELRLAEVMPDLNAALRRARSGADRLDPDRMLATINGMYLLATIRDCRESLAVNARFDQVWTQTGEALGLYCRHNLELLQADPQNPVIAARLDGAIIMAQVRFNQAYAETLRRARAVAERRS